MAWPSDRVLAVGDTGSGKSHFLNRHVLPRHPRCIILDVTGEMWERRAALGGTTALAETAADVLRAVRGVAARGTWRVFAVLSDQETAALARALVPERIASAPSLVRAVGGCALYCDELELVAGHSSPPEIAGIWNRGRHVGLSVIGATQYPAAVRPLVRGASRLFVIGQLTDPNAREYLAKVLPPEVSAWVDGLEYQSLVIFDKQGRQGWRLARDGRLVDSYRPER